MDLNDYYGSDWLTHEDIDPDEDTIVTIRDLEEVEMKSADDDKEAEAKTKIAVYFDELEKPLVLNKTNARTIGALYGVRSVEKSWPGKMIALWVNHDIEYQAKTVSAIRVRSRAPKPKPKPKARRKPAKRTAKKGAKKS